MFGLIISGRLPQTNFCQVDENKLLIDIPDIDNVNYLVVFLTGTQPLPNGSVASVYFSWPNPQGTPTWMHLGHLSNSKASAIFKIVHLKKMREQEFTPNAMVFGNTKVFHSAQLGLALEPESCIAQPVGSLEISDETKINYCQKMLESFYQYAASFAVNAQQLTANPIQGEVVPLNTLHNWYNQFRTRLQRNPNFWKY